MRRQAGLRPDSPLVIEPDTGRTMTFAGAADVVGAMAGILAALGLSPGDRAIAVCPNSVAAAAAHLGVLGAGFVLVPAGPSSSGPELRRLAAHSGASLALVAPELAGGIARELSASPEAGLRFADPRFEDPEDASRPEAGDDLVVLRLPAAADVPEADVPEGAPEAPPPDLALILYTSGTTGPPKGVMLTGANLLAEAAAVAEAHRLTPDDRALCLLPLHHVNGLVVTLLTPLLVGHPVLMPPRFSAGRFWGWAADGRATWFSAVPTILSILLGREFPPPERLGRLRFARSASSPLPLAVLAEFERRLGRPVIESYGVSEAASQVTSNPLPPGERVPGSVGVPFGGCRIRVAEGVPGAPPGEGEVLVGGPNVSPGYWRDPEATRAAFVDGWFRTGDLGRIGEGGRLFLTGRLKELVNRAGEMISPREVDEVLHQWPGIESAAAVGVPHPLYGEEVVAFAVPRPGLALDEASILEFCRRRLSPHKAPKRVYPADDLPKGPSGKIQRLRLAERYRALAEAGDGAPGDGPGASAAPGTGASAPPASGTPDAGPGASAEPESGTPGDGPRAAPGRRFRVAVDFQACKGCRYCLAVCPASVFGLGSARNAAGHVPPEAERPEDCVGCRACFMACPDFCLEVEAR